MEWIIQDQTQTQYNCNPKMFFHWQIPLVFRQILWFYDAFYYSISQVKKQLIQMKLEHARIFKISFVTSTKFDKQLY